MSLRTVDARVRQFVRLALTALAAVVLFVPPARAHFVFPTTLDLRPGAIGYIYVLDQSVPLCAADITAINISSDLTVCAVDMSSPGLNIPQPGCPSIAPNRIDQVYLVTASANAANGSHNVGISWVGEHVGGPGPCQEDNTLFPVLRASTSVLRAHPRMVVFPLLGVLGSTAALVNATRMVTDHRRWKTKAR